MTFAFDMTVTLSLGFAIASAGYAFFRTRRADVSKSFEKHDSRLGELEGRLTTLEAEVSLAPGKDEMHKLDLAISEMNGEMKAIGSQLRGTNVLLRTLQTTVARQEEYLLGAKK